VTTHSPQGALPTAKKSGAGKWVVLAIGCAVVLVLVFVGSIVVAIVVPNFLDAANKAKQKRTIADMGTLGVSVFSYTVDHMTPEGDVVFPEASSIEELVAILQPEYLAQPLHTDGWGNPYRYACRREPGAPGCNTFRLISPGRDGAFEHDDPWSYGAEVFADRAFDRDIVYADGAFLQYPGRPEE
jgi:hypothetical protein